MLLPRPLASYVACLRARTALSPCKSGRRSSAPRPDRFSIAKLSKGRTMPLPVLLSATLLKYSRIQWLTLHRRDSSGAVSFALNHCQADIIAKRTTIGEVLYGG